MNSTNTTTTINNSRNNNININTSSRGLSGTTATSAASIDFGARLLQEMVALRSDVSQQGIQLNVLNDGFRQQFTAPQTEEERNLGNDGRSIIDPVYRSQLMANRNRYGSRIIDPNINKTSRATPVQRYNAMLQRLHQLHHGATAQLTTAQLTTRRTKMHRSAKRVVDAIVVMHPTIAHWGKLEEEEQTYYSLALEDQIRREDNLMICWCKKQWCGRLLLQQAYKAGRARVARASAAVATADAAANDAANSTADAATNVDANVTADAAINAANTSTVANDSNDVNAAQTGNNLLQDGGLSTVLGAHVSVERENGAGHSAVDAEDDDNTSTTSNL